MKKILIAVLAFAIIGVFATGCWHSKETPISDEISTYTVKESGYVGLKRTGAPAGENLTEAIYVQADETINGYILAQCKRDADGTSRWAILDPKTAKPVTDLRFEKVWIGDSYLIMLAKEKKYFFANYNGYQVTGPYDDVAYYPSRNKLFTKVDGKWGVDMVLEPAYKRLLMITDGTNIQYIGIDGKKAVLIDPTGKVIKKNIPVANVTKMEEKNAKKVWTYQDEVSILSLKSLKSAI